MLHAHLIMIHAEPAQLGRLLRAIDHPQNLFLVHVDRKSPPDVHDAVATFCEGRPNIHRMAPRDVRWASWSVVDATLAGIAELLRLDPHWTHFSNLSGQDFPLRSQAAILARLHEHPEANYVQHWNPDIWLKGADRIRHVRVEPAWPKRGYTLPLVMWDRWSRILGETSYRGGSSYFTLTRPFCEHMLSSPKLPAFRRFFRYCYSADEIFLPSFIVDSPWRDSLINDDLRLIDFSEGLPRPRTWTIADANTLLASNKLYARKFDPRVDAAIIDHLERHSASDG